jgi:phosphoserine phosphatase
MPFDKALEARLEIMKPSQQSVEKVMKTHPFRLTPGIEELVGLLHEKNVHVYLVSGSFRHVCHLIHALLKQTSLILTRNILLSRWFILLQIN